MGTPPRGGGLLDQPANEIAYLDKVFEAHSLHEERTAERDKRRAKFKSDHKPPSQ